MEIRLHALQGMHFIMYHHDHPIRKRHSSFSSAHKNTKTPAQRLQKCPLPVKSVFEKNAFTDVPSPKKNGERNSLSPIFCEGRGASVSVTDVFTGYMWKVGQIGEKKHPFTNKSVYVRKGPNIYCLL